MSGALVSRRPPVACGDGSADAAREVDRLARRLPEPLAPLARLAWNHRWGWTLGAAEVFARLDPDRFARLGECPVWLLRDADELALLRAAADDELVARGTALAAELDEELARPGVELFPDGRPAVFLCAEFGLHQALPIYAGGLGVLAADVLRGASDLGLPLVGVGLLYRRGFGRQSLDRSGWQREHWPELDPRTLPLARVTREDGAPLVVSVPVWEREVSLHVWRAEVGRVPLFLLDADLEQNGPVERWITARVYDGSPAIRLAQYAALGVGGMAALRAMGIDPAVVHVNEGHAALAPLALAAEAAPGLPLGAALETVRDRIAFTTHTAVATGNETYPWAEARSVLARAVESLGFSWDAFSAQCRTEAGEQELGFTPLAIRASGRASAVARRHARLVRGRFPDELPPGGINAIANGVHLPTWVAPPLGALLDRQLGPAWRTHPDAAPWDAIGEIDDVALWAVRRELRATLVQTARRRATADLLLRGASAGEVAAARQMLDPDVLTVGFARRLATHKRLDLLAHDPDRLEALLVGARPVQLVLAGKAHPLDDEAKAVAQRTLGALRDLGRTGRLVFLDDHDLGVARTLVAGCDVWLGLSRPPLEASGTSGIKAAANGGLNLAVLDGWWREAHDGTNGWVLDGDDALPADARDARDADRLLDLLEREVAPTFYERDARGVPVAWLAMVRRALRTVMPRYGAARLLSDYVRLLYAPDGSTGAG